MSRSGYYAWQRREQAGPTPRQQRRTALTDKIITFHADSDQVYGSPRILADLREDGETVSRKTVAKLMRSNGIVGISPRGWTPVTTWPDLAATSPAGPGRAPLRPRRAEQGVDQRHRAPRGVREPWRWWEAIAGCLSQQACGSWRTVDCLGVGVVGGAVLDNDESFQYCQMGRARLARRRGIREEPAAESSSRRNHRPETWRTWVGSHRAPVGLRPAGNFPAG